MELCAPVREDSMIILPSSTEAFSKGNINKTFKPLSSLSILENVEEDHWMLERRTITIGIGDSDQPNHTINKFVGATTISGYR